MICVFSQVVKETETYWGRKRGRLFLDRWAHCKAVSSVVKKELSLWYPVSFIEGLHLSVISNPIRIQCTQDAGQKELCGPQEIFVSSCYSESEHFHYFLLVATE